MNKPIPLWAALEPEEMGKLIDTLGAEVVRLEKMVSTMEAEIERLKKPFDELVKDSLDSSEELKAEIEDLRRLNNELELDLANACKRIDNNE